MQLQVFKYSEKQVRTHIDGDGNPWWSAADVCEILALNNVAQAVSRLDEDEHRVITSNDGVGRRNKLGFVNEPGLYSLVLASKKAEAKTFKRWIAHEVLPSIRKTGTYSVTSKQWSIARDESKASRRVETDVIAKFIAYAKEQGSQNAEKYYLNFSKMVNTELLVLDGGKAPAHLRDTLNMIQLHTLSVAESIVARTLIECMTEKRPYKEVYQAAKEKIAALGLAVGKTRPGISAREFIGLVA